MESVKMNITFMGEPNEDNEMTAGEIISLNVPISQVEKINKNIDDKWAENLTIAQALKKLNQREKDIIARRFFDGRTQMEVAEEIGISQAQVSRLEKDAIDRIRKIYK